MRVLFLATRDWYDPAAAGGDTVMWEFARFLASRGHAVTYVASSYAGSKKEEIVDGVKVVRLGGVPTLWLRTFTYYMRRCRGRFDVVVAEGFGGSRIPRWAPLYVKEPFITEWHQVHKELFSVQYPILLRPFLNLLERLTALIHRNTLIRAGTVEWRRAFQSLGFREENIFVVPPSISEDWVKGNSPNPVSEPRIIWLGKFRRYKCPDHTIAALKHVVNRVPNAHLILAGRHGDIRYEKKLQALARHLGVEKHVEFRFSISEAEKKDLLLKCRALLLPSSVEGFGIVALEANACGVPVIASSGVPESVVQHGYNGLRYPFGDIQALAKNIIRILTDNELHRKLSANSLSFAKKFMWSRIGSEFEKTIVALMQSKRGK